MKKTSRPYTLFFWLAFSIVIVLNLLVWIYLQQVEKQFKDELGTHLSDVQQVLNKLIEEYNYSMDLSLLLPSDKTSVRYLYFQQPLDELRLKSNLQSILLVNPNGEILVSSPQNLGKYQFSSMAANSNFQSALKGASRVSEIQEFSGERFMSAYAPIKNVDGFLLAVLVIEAKADFFQVLSNLKNRLLLFSAINLLVILLIAILLYRMIQRNLSYQSELKDQEHLVELGTMAASVAHELRNPLGIIEGTNDVIQKKYGSGNDEIFSYIPDEVTRLNRLIDEFLTFSRTPKLNIKNLDLDELFDHILKGLDPDFRQRLEVSELPTYQIKTDQLLLEQALFNIILNAFQASPAPYPVRVQVSSSKNGLIFEIIDHGSGIPETDQETIFKPFFTTKEQGTGLGLAIVKRIIRHLKGDIRFENILSAGTKFTILIPNYQN